jgi:hypothetical protein
MRKRKASGFSGWLWHEARLSRFWIVRQVENGGMKMGARGTRPSERPLRKERCRSSANLSEGRVP